MRSDGGNPWNGKARKASPKRWNVFYTIALSSRLVNFLCKMMEGKYRSRVVKSFSTSILLVSADTFKCCGLANAPDNREVKTLLLKSIINRRRVTMKTVGDFSFRDFSLNAVQFFISFIYLISN